MAARLLRKAGDQGRAADMLVEVVEMSADSSRKDRAIWYLLDMSLSESPERILSVISKYAPLWQQGSYFDDILEKLISRWVAGRKWNNLSALYRALNLMASGDIQGRLAFILARALTYGYLPQDSVEEGVELLEEAAVSNPAGYYGMIAAVLLGKATIVGLKPDEQAIRITGSLSEDSITGPEALAAGFFRFGLPLYGYRIVREQGDFFSPANIMGAAEELNRAGFFLESIRLMNTYKSRLKSQSILSPGAYRLLYPTAFIADIAELSRSGGFPPMVLLALVREESHFDAHIVSRAGAVGLTQLMVPTAEDMAGLLKIKKPDLFDPHTNLVLGTEHFGRLLKRLGSIPKGLLAYNAGLSRLRQWERALGDLPIDLFIEALPYQESRHYLRKILVSSIYYGYLYRGVSPEESVKLFFPEAFKK
jgi:soluble lytic murein transglycosylase